MTHEIIGQHIRIRELEAEREELRKQLSALALALFQKHFASVEPYVNGDVTWRVFTEPQAILSQIDNMTAGLVRVPDNVHRDAKRLETLLTALVNSDANADWLKTLNQASATAAHSGVEAVKHAIDYTAQKMGPPKVPPADAPQEDAPAAQG